MKIIRKKSYSDSKTKRNFKWLKIGKNTHYSAYIPIYFGRFFVYNISANVDNPIKERRLDINEI